MHIEITLVSLLKCLNVQFISHSRYNRVVHIKYQLDILSIYLNKVKNGERFGILHEKKSYYNALSIQFDSIHLSSVQQQKETLWRNGSIMNGQNLDVSRALILSFGKIIRLELEREQLVNQSSFILLISSVCTKRTPYMQYAYLLRANTCLTIRRHTYHD